MQGLRKVIPFLLALWYRVVNRQRLVVVESRQPSPARPDKALPKQVRETVEDVEAQIVWNLKSTILERLDEYFVTIQRLKRRDVDAYNLYSRVGFSVSSDRFFIGDKPEVRSRLADPANRVAFGGIMFPRPDDDSPNISPSFIYFQKLRKPSKVQRFDGDVYSLTVIYDQRYPNQHWRSKLIWPVKCHVGIDARGGMTLLKDQVTTESKIQPRPKRKHGHRPEAIRLRVSQWRYPDWLDGITEDHDVTAEQWATSTLATAMTTHLACIKKIIVRAGRGDLTASFGIELPRAKYFFADRDKTKLAVDGKRKRIFHSVVAHPRKTLKHKPEVTAHYRGLRHFDWRGYQIRIVAPTNNFIPMFSASGSYADDVSASQIEKWKSLGETGKAMQEILDS